MDSNIFVGADPLLFYYSVALAIGGLVLKVLFNKVFSTIIQTRIARKVPNIRDAIQGHPIGHMEFSRIGRYSKQVAATKTTLTNSVGIVALANLLYYVCWLAMLAGGVGVVLYLVQRFDVV